MAVHQQQQQQQQQHEATSLLGQVRVNNNDVDESMDASVAAAPRRKAFFGILAISVLAAMAALLFGGFSNSGQPSSSLREAAASDSAASREQALAKILDLEGSSKKKEKKKKKKDDHHEHHHEQDEDESSTCDDGGYSKRTLQKAYELPFASLFNDNKGQNRYEASSVVVVGDNAYAVCDNSWAISKFDRKLEPFLETNVQVGDPSREEGEDSGYEALFHDSGDFYVVRESVQHGDQTYHAIIEKLHMGADDCDVVEACSSEFEFEGDSKGFEGAVAIRDLNNELVVLGLCEGNYCSETRKNEKGNGRIVAMKREEDGGDGSCRWKTLRMIELPSSADFRDYSAMTLSETSPGRVAVSSQEESQLWVGQLLGRDDATGLWDVDALAFDPDVGKLYDFPKNDDCKTVYCNVEGVHWLNDEMIIAVSDKMKSKGKQDFRCFEKDQSVHVFVLP